MQTLQTDICVIGAGAAGLSVAAGAVQLGVDVVLIEKGAMGGDCLNTGCVPSKSLLHVAHAYAAGRSLVQAGLAQSDLSVNFGKALGHVHEVIAEIAPVDSVERFTDLGVRVIQAAAHFDSPTSLIAGDQRIEAKRFVIATGARPFIPPIKGLATVPYLTNETIFNLKARPQHLLIIGGGAVGLELAQAHRRLGARVTVFEQGQLLGQEDRDMVDLIKAQLSADGVTFYEETSISKVAQNGRRIEVSTKGETVTGSHLLVACGREAHTDGLGLDRAGVEATKGWIQVDRRLRTTNKRIFALGDAIGGLGSTHRAGYHAGIVIRNALFFIPTRVDETRVPVAIYTQPEFARIGITETQARKLRSDILVSQWPFSENDRATTESDRTGRVKLVTQKNGRVLGVSIVGAHAADLLVPWILVMAKGLSLADIAGLVIPYPTRSEASKRAAGDFYARRLFSPFMRAVVGLLGRFRR
jgi:pyruvate/2-oxoglutarate dehydrogenase complex dihydrolipoamide dehydrogenase (E3) component